MGSEEGDLIGLWLENPELSFVLLITASGVEHLRSGGFGINIHPSCCWIMIQ